VWLLKETNMKITDIAERLDYKDMGYFSRLFKNKYKLPPSAYRLSDGDDYQI
jgi:AraC-like DNA-binding protein